MVDYSQYAVTVMDITPDLALEWLARNTHNRAIRKGHVAELAWDMRIGRWRVTHQGIAFDASGRLLDGQHRLLAVVEAGVTVRMMVTTGVPIEASGVIDTGAKRNLADGMMLSGREKMVTVGGSVGARNTNAAMWRAMMGGLSGLKQKSTHEQVYRFADAHKSAGQFALIEFGKHPRIKFIHTAPIMATVARAYYHYRDRVPELQRFVSLLCTGIGSDAFSNNDTVLRFRNTLLQRLSGRNSNASGEIYGKCSSALKGFMDGKSLSKFYEPAEELFPLPEESTTNLGRTDRMAGDSRRSGAGGSGADLLAEMATRSVS